jgi:hypothetical protein
VVILGYTFRTIRATFYQINQVLIAIKKLMEKENAEK